ncbi:sigma-70 family RNA polymerase sigma factor [Altererythrobacter luteolus]|uniref:Sigma-70 family RNA polymerase sigma factor n=1 Tax=Pontixanthobacter luteolus TaxID=295089 RepID=A0A6I4V2E8_9SPHN|nr:RNA polymerase sigma factor [Pontixanthobacter luteolus]MXP48347.1 sigma-70 family RNA polymerase sigma factor [Pontixanthobacter luteolus]
MDSGALLRAIGRGDRAAFTRLYREVRPAMMAHAAAILKGDFSTAEDVVDEAFTDIWRLAGKFKDINNAPAWIRRIVRNKAIDYLRKPASRETSQESAFFEHYEDQAPNPEEAAMIDDDSRWLRSALAILNLDQREAVVLCYFEAMPLQEIAQATDCSVNTVKTRLHYARRKLRGWMEAQNQSSAAPEPANNRDIPRLKLVS